MRIFLYPEEKLTNACGLFGFFSENKHVTLCINQQRKENNCPDIKTLHAFAMWCHGLPLQGKFLPFYLLNRWRTLWFAWTVHSNISPSLATALVNIFN